MMTVSDVDAPLSPRMRVWRSLSPTLWALSGIIIVGGMVAMLFGHAAPSPLGTELAFAGAGVAGVVIGWAARHRPLFSGRGPVVWGLISGLFAYIALSDGYLWAVDRFLGAPAERTVVITGWNDRKGARYDCNHFIYGGEGFDMKPVCVDLSYRDEAIPGRHLVLIGRATPLGMAVESWRLGPRP